MAVVNERDKTHPQDRILDTSIPMNNEYTRDLINKVMAAAEAVEAVEMEIEAVEAENQRRRRCHVPLPPVRHVDHQPHQKISSGEDCELSLELSLGLSSNGLFGFDPNAKKIKRTASSMIPATADGSGSGSGSGGGNLIRTCSLPAESREEWLRRKELQSQRRMEARKRKNEKRRHSRAARERERNSRSTERGAGSEDGGENSNNNNLVEQDGASAGADGLIRTTSLVRRVGGIVLNNAKEKDQVVPISPPSGPIAGSGSSSGTSGTLESEVQVQQHGQGITPMDTENSNADNIAEPQNKPKVMNLFEGSSSSKIAEPQNKTKAVNLLEGSGPQNKKKVVRFLEGSNSGNIAGPQNKKKVVRFLEDLSSSKIAGPQSKPKTVNLFEGSSSSKIAGAQNKTKAARNPLDDMPSVTTKGNGPNGKRIEGFLYKYGRGKDVRIVCVCHGSFLTPAEFVKHAGGGDVPNPLKQIVVNSSSS
ncbi:ninja-family protein AFP2 isoform X2 [Lathyrus oleraceus]|uniref:ninja-family protein AFP2 isoform X2 n=1 Tax=Pisum sativum TaxID=3888 RepID=UPI0021CF2EB7|nr:ninja-family protein AFP2-like isoform X2 [Pisum sativum]